MKMKRIKCKWQSYKRLKYSFLLSIEYMFCRQVWSFYRWFYRHRENCEELAEDKFMKRWDEPFHHRGGYGFSTALMTLLTIYFFPLISVFFLEDELFLGESKVPDYIDVLVTGGCILLGLLLMPLWYVADVTAHPVHKEFLQWPHERRRRWCRRSLRILAFLLFFPWTVKLLLWLTGNESFVTLLMKIWG